MRAVSFGKKRPVAAPLVPNIVPSISAACRRSVAISNLRLSLETILQFFPHLFCETEEEQKALKKEGESSQVVRQK